ncbi:MAG: hypothetical protein ACM3JJ_12635 [Hyphomicrobiales bacterium]
MSRAPEASHANQILVTIAVQDNKLCVYPRREDDAVIYCNSEKPGEPPDSPEKPQQICWVVKDLEEMPTTRRVLIKANEKNGTRVFKESEWEINGTTGPYAVSGPVVAHPVKGSYTPWKYDIELLDTINGTETRLDYIDPTVVIKTDP